MTTTFHSKIFAVLLLALSCVLPAVAHADDKAALAREYVATVPVESEVKQAIEHMAQQVPADQRVLFRQLGEKSIDYTRLRAEAEKAVADTFTEAEIKAMTEFYKSPEGQSVRAKMPEYDKKMEPVMNAILQDFVKKLQENNVLPGMTPAH